MTSCCPDESLDSRTPYESYYWHSKGVVDKVCPIKTQSGQNIQTVIDRWETWKFTGQGLGTSASSGVMTSTGSR